MIYINKLIKKFINWWHCRSKVTISNYIYAEGNYNSSYNHSYVKGNYDKSFNCSYIEGKNILRKE